MSKSWNMPLPAKLAAALRAIVRSWPSGRSCSCNLAVLWLSLEIYSYPEVDRIRAKDCIRVLLKVLSISYLPQDGCKVDIAIDMDMVIDINA